MSQAQRGFGARGRHGLRLVLWGLYACGVLTGASAAADGQPPLDAAAITLVQPLPDGMEIVAGTLRVLVTAVRDDLLRIRISPTPELAEDASWAVLPVARASRVPVSALPSDEGPGFRTAQLQVHVQRSPLRIVVSDLAGHVICADAPGQPVQFAAGGFAVRKAMPEDAHFFGLGDKAGAFDRRNQAFTLWNTDHGIQVAQDPLYKSVPFFLAISEGRAYGLLLDNTWRSWFDFGKRDRDSYAFGAEGGPLDYYVIYGPSPRQVVEGYAFLTGTPPLPPLWALGFQQSRYSYAPQARVREIANHLRADAVPADAIYLDIDYQDRHRPFTVDPQGFAGFAAMVQALRLQHFHLVAITDLHIANVSDGSYAPYSSGHAGDHFVKNPDGTEYSGIVWPGQAVFPDFTRASTRQWWGGLYRQFVEDGVAGFWNDMNEPSVFGAPGNTLPLDSVHRIEEDGFAPRRATHAEIHNVFGMQNQRATYEGLLQLRPMERPFVLTRAAYAGSQRYGFTWTGDNAATWDQLRLGNQMLMNLGVSGFAFAGNDVGGFASSPQPDLLTRWTQIGAFTPMFRNHSAVGTLAHEVWVDGARHERLRRRAIQWRYRLLPYLYTLAEEASRTGVPLMRPVFLEFPEVLDASYGGFEGLDSQFMLGPALMIAPPPFGETRDRFAVDYPPGRWFDFWTGRPVAAQPRAPRIADIAMAAPGTRFAAPARQPPVLQMLPVYVREGSILPLQPLVQYTDAKPDGPLQLRVYPGAHCAGSVYQDDGHSFEYREGVYLRQRFSCQVQGDALRLAFDPREGTFAPWWHEIEVVIYDWPAGRTTARLGTITRPLALRYDSAARALHVRLPDVAHAAVLSVVHRPDRGHPAARVRGAP